MLTFIPGPPDSELVLQAAVTKTATFSSAWLDLGSCFAPGGLGMPVAGVVNVTAFDHTTGDETYTFKLQETDPDDSGAAVDGSARDIGASVALSATGLIVTKGFITSRFVRLVMTAAGTTPSVTYSGQLNP